MLTLGFLTLSVGLVPLAILFALGRLWILDVAFIRLAWVPVAALALQAMIWRPMTQTLGYASIIPPLLTCIVSLFLRHRRCHASGRELASRASSRTSLVHYARQRARRHVRHLRVDQLRPLLLRKELIRERLSGRVAPAVWRQLVGVVHLTLPSRSLPTTFSGASIAASRRSVGWTVAHSLLA